MDQIRKEFPFFEAHPDVVYLDSAATTQKPQAVIENLTRFYAKEYATVHRAVYKSAALATDRYQAVRERAAQFLNAAKTDEIVFTRGTTDAINLVAHSWGRTHLKPGDEIALSSLEHHSNLVPWQMLADATGATLRWIPATSVGHLRWKGIIGPKTKLVAVAHMSNVTGIIHPIEEMAEEAHRHGAILVVDGAQGAPHLPVDVQMLGADFYAFSGHKCYGPTGIGILYGKSHLLESMPPLMGGGDMIDRVSLQKTTYAIPPLRFEAGTPMIGSVIGLDAALNFLQEIGMEQILEHEKALGKILHDGLKQIEGVQILGEGRTIATFLVEGVHPLDLAVLLDQEGFALRSGNLCAQPALEHFGCKAAIRASVGIYNTKSEIEQFLNVLPKLLWTMKRFSI